MGFVLAENSDEFGRAGSVDPDNENEKSDGREPNGPERRVANPAVVVTFIMMSVGAKTKQNRNRGQREEGHDVSEPLVGRQVHAVTRILRTVEL